MKIDFTALIKKLKKVKHIEIIAAVLIALLVIIIYFIPTEKSNNISEQTVISNNSETDEQRLEHVLSQIKGAGKVSVMISYENNGEVVLAKKEQQQKNTVSESDVSGQKRESETFSQSSDTITINNGGNEQPLVLLEKKPVVRGVIVVSEGAADIAVKLNLQRAVIAALQIEAGKVEIFVMNKK